ncbi:MAG: hypothetical protein II712_04495 [Erysipelotrichaceae bacterium]|nr:hypothetical protein [Erysipelotrichaceae bacterium]
MKKLMSLLLAASLLFTAAGCGSRKSASAIITMAKSEYDYNSQIGFSVDVMDLREDDSAEVLVVSTEDSTVVAYRRKLKLGENSLSTGAMTDGNWKVSVLINDKEVASKKFTVKGQAQIELSATKEVKGDYTYITFSMLPIDVSQLKTLDLTDEFISAAAFIAVLCEYEFDPENCLTMIDYMDGPNTISNVDKGQMDEQFKQYPYFARSYFEGTSPDNNYYPDGYTIRLFEGSNSRSEAGYVTLRVQSSGADSSRTITLKQVGSTGEWFAVNYMGLLSGIRAPKEDDPWN